VVTQLPRTKDIDHWSRMKEVTFVRIKKRSKVLSVVHRSSKFEEGQVYYRELDCRTSANVGIKYLPTHLLRTCEFNWFFKAM